MIMASIMNTVKHASNNWTTGSLAARWKEMGICHFISSKQHNEQWTNNRTHIDSEADSAG